MTTDVVPAFSEANIEKALIDAQGDLYVASDLLGGVTLVALDRAIRRSERLQHVFSGIKAVRALPNYDRLSGEQVAEEVRRRLTIYRADALEALHQLATMPVSEDGFANQTKMAAAVRLMGGGLEHSQDAGGIDDTLRQLNEQYQRDAPKIRSIRERIVEFETDSPAIEGRTS